LPPPANRSNTLTEEETREGAVKAKKTRKGDGFWEKIDLDRSGTGGGESKNGMDVDNQNALGSSNYDDDGEEDFLGPSPIKSLNKYKKNQFSLLTTTFSEPSASKGNGKSPHSEAESDGDDEPMDEDDVTMNRKSAEKKQKIKAASAFQPSTLNKPKTDRPPSNSATLPPPPPPKASQLPNGKGKKRAASSKLGALVPFDTFADEHLESASGAGPSSLKSGSLAVPSNSSADQKSRSRSRSPIFLETRDRKQKRRTPAEDSVSHGPLDVSERQIESTSKRVRTGETVASGADTDRENAEMEQASEAEEGDYDTQNLSDEYEDYTTERFRSKSVEPPHRDQRNVVGHASSSTVQERRGTPDVTLDESLDPHLVSLLSLKASPVKNHRTKLHKKREEAVMRLLREPSYLLKTGKTIKGLEDLEDDEFAEAIAHADDRREDSLDLGQEQMDNGQSESDDDWASETEGWKDLGDGEMDGLDF